MLRLPSELETHLQGGGTLIVPTRQRARAVRLAHATRQLEGGARVWQSADVLPLSGWQRREAEALARAAPATTPRLLAAVEEWYLWRSCTLEAVRELTLLDGSALAGGLAQAAELARDWQIPIERALPGSEAELLALTRQAFAQRCRELASLDAATLLERHTPQEPAPWRCGFLSTPPRYAMLPSPPPAAAMTVPTLQRPADAAEEAEQIAAWCAEQLVRNAKARLLVIAPGSEGGRERLADAIRGALDPRAVLSADPAAEGWVGIEGGEALSQQPMIAQALATLGWLSGESFDFATLSHWLNAPQWSQPSAALRAHLALLLAERGLVSFSLRTLLNALEQLPPPLAEAARAFALQLATAAARLPAGRASPRQWAERCSAALLSARWPGDLAADGPGQQTLSRWHEFLEEFAQLNASVAALTRHEALELLRALAARSRYRPADEDLTVTVSAALADPVVRYDGIWACGLSADVLPQPVQPDPFLPLAAQLRAAIPSASSAGRLREAHALLQRWRASTPQLVLSVPLLREDTELQMSPLLAAWPPQARAARLPALAQRLHRADQTESFSDERGVPWDRRRRLPRGTRTLELQNLCAFRAYAELRLNAVTPQTPEPGIAATLRGQLLHAALQFLWEELRDSRALAQLSDTALEACIARSVTRASRLLLQQGPRGRRRRAAEQQLDMFSITPPVLTRECRRAARLIRALCERERSRPPFVVEAAERSVPLTLGGATLEMRLDRIDRLADGGHAVLDYKSGAWRGAADWLGARPSYPQLLAYTQALSDVAAFATVHIHARGVRFDGLARTADVLPEVETLAASELPPQAAWAAQLARWRATLEDLIAAFLAGDARLDPRPGACTFCHLGDVCRIGERGTAAGDPAGDADE